MDNMKLIEEIVNAGFIVDTGESHDETIICPECNSEQVGTVEHLLPFASYVHVCTNCNYTIMESEWNKK